MVKEKQFKYRVWIHPKNGGDDREAEIIVSAATYKRADELVKKWLSKRSDISTDFWRMT